MPIVSKRGLLWFLAVAVGIGVVAAVVVAFGRYPRRVLLSDVQQSKKIVVEWQVPDGNHTSRPIAFELDEHTRAQFVRGLTKNLGVDYFRGQATVTPTIGIYLVDNRNEFLAYYGIRCARGGGRCPSMESLRETASKGRPLSEIEADNIFNDDALRSKWPQIIPGSFDYVLPVTPSATNRSWEELRRVPPPDPRLRHTLKGHTKPLLSVAFSPDSKTVATGGWDTTIRLWDVATGKNTATFTGHAKEVRSVAFSPDGKTLASAGGNDLTIRLWEVATGKNFATLSGHEAIVASVAYSPDGKILASGSWDRTIKLWDAATGKNVTTLNGHHEYVDCLVFSPDGKTLASGSADAAIKLWAITTGENTATLNGHSRRVSSVAFSPDGTVLGSASPDSTVRLWDMSSGKTISTLKSPSTVGSGGDVLVAFTPDGKTLITGGFCRKIKLWDVATGKGITIFSGDIWNAGCMAVSPDGKSLACGSGDEDGTARLWDMTCVQGTVK